MGKNMLYFRCRRVKAAFCGELRSRFSNGIGTRLYRYELEITQRVFRDNRPWCTNHDNLQATSARMLGMSMKSEYKDLTTVKRDTIGVYQEGHSLQLPSGVLSVCIPWRGSKPYR
jgi:hypothetical protein